MPCMNRRKFLTRTAGALAAGFACAQGRLSFATEAPKVPLATATRVLGKTGIETSSLGMGTGVRAWNKSSGIGREGYTHAIRTLRHSFDAGVRYLDLADMYGSHEYARDAIRDGNIPREKLMILTKTTSTDAAGVRKDLDRFRKEVNTDYFDVVLLHCMTEGGWTEKLAGCMDVLAEAKQQGIIRAHGVSCHNLDAMKVASTHPWVDVMLNRINPAGNRMDGTVEEVVEVLKTGHENGKGMIGMKILGEGDIADRANESIKFVFGLGYIDAITIGFLKPEEIDDIAQRMESLGTA